VAVSDDRWGVREWLGAALYVIPTVVVYVLFFAKAISLASKGDVLGYVLLASVVLIGLFIVLYFVASRGTRGP
jgi:hypothetical protein